MLNPNWVDLRRLWLYLVFIAFSMKSLIVHINSQLGETVNTRGALSTLLSKIQLQEKSTLVVDFSDVEFISRAFADELVKKREEWQQKGIKVILQNVGENVLNMLNAVARTQQAKKRNTEEVQVIHYSELSALDDFLLSL